MPLGSILPQLCALLVCEPPCLTHLESWNTTLPSLATCMRALHVSSRYPAPPPAAPANCRPTPPNTKAVQKPGLQHHGRITMRDVLKLATVKRAPVRVQCEVKHPVVGLRHARASTGELGRIDARETGPLSPLRCTHSAWP